MKTIPFGIDCRRGSGVGSESDEAMKTRRGAAARQRPANPPHGCDRHAANVAWLAAQLCNALGVQESLALRIVRGARSHDVGKRFISSELLDRPGPLNRAEREQMKQHVAWGASILALRAASEDVDLSVESAVALLHHERWDGGGYPYGLAGEQIPLEARIVAVVDVYDALVSARPYKAAWRHEHAIELIRDGRGHHFDPACADAFIELASVLPTDWRGRAWRWQRQVDAPRRSTPVTRLVPPAAPRG